MSSDVECNSIQAALEAGKLLGGLEAKPRNTPEGDGIPYLILPEGTTIESIEPLLPNPVRQRAIVVLRDAASFASYVKRFTDKDATMVFADLGKREFTGVIDYHVPGTDAQWGQHRATMTCLLTEDWKRWMASNKKAMSQVDFAQYIEDNIPNIAAPTGAELLEMTKTLIAKKDVQFSSSVRLDNGQHELTYAENVSATSGQAGHLRIPHSFTLGIEPFEGAGRYEVEARFRYRITGSVLSMWYDLLRPEQVIEDAFKRTREEIELGVEPVVVLAGSAPTIPGA